MINTQQSDIRIWFRRYHDVNILRGLDFVRCYSKIDLCVRGLHYYLYLRSIFKYNIFRSGTHKVLKYSCKFDIQRIRYYFCKYILCMMYIIYNYMRGRRHDVRCQESGTQFVTSRNGTFTLNLSQKTRIVRRTLKYQNCKS